MLIVFAFLAFGKAVIAQVGTPSENDYTYQLIAAADQRLETQPSLALLYIDSALVRSYELEDRQAEAYCYLTLGKIQTKLRRFPIASDHLDQASSLFAKVRDEEGVYQTQRAQARLLMAMRRWAEAKGAWQTFREAAQTKTRWQDIATAETQLAQIALNQDAFAEALPHFSNALELNRDNNEPDGVIAAYNSLSATCNTMGDTVMGNLYSLQAGQFALENGFFSPPRS
ncbi:MAG: tetratricopeptide repeat protein, partial [Bacteroidota bacterium]